MSLLLLFAGAGAASATPEPEAATALGEQPVACLRISENGGKTWGNERSRLVGAKGEWNTRVIWTRCGSGRRWTPELTFTDPIPWRILGAFVDVLKETP